MIKPSSLVNHETIIFVLMFQALSYKREATKCNRDASDEMVPTGTILEDFFYRDGTIVSLCLIDIYHGFNRQ